MQNKITAFQNNGSALSRGESDFIQPSDSNPSFGTILSRGLWGLFVLAFFGPWIRWPRAIWRRVWPFLTKHRRRGLVVLPWLLFPCLFCVQMATRGQASEYAQAWAVTHLDQASPWMLAWSPPLFFAISTLFLAPIHVLSMGLFGGEAAPKERSHGSARWSHGEDGGSLTGFALGWVHRSNGRSDGRWRTTRHVLTCAPTGTGKGIGCVIPNLLEYTGSVFCLDVKGENLAVTGRRREELCQKVVPIDPFGIRVSKSHGFNPIDWVDLDKPDAISDAGMLAETLVVKSPNRPDPHWDESAETLLRGLLLHVATLPKEERHLGTLRKILTMPEGKLLALLEELAKDEDVAFGVIARAANSFLGKADRERSGVLSTAQRHTDFLDDPRIAKTLMRSDVDFSELKTRRTSIYLVIPPDRLGSQGRFVRLALALALKAMYRSKSKRKHDVAFFLDEFAQLGHFPPIEDGISILRGYGVQLWLLVQDLSQLESVYPKWRTFLANSTLQAFGTQDQMTARYISEALGTETISFSTTSDSTNSGWGTTPATKSRTTAEHRHARPLLLPDEVRSLYYRKVIVLEQGKPPILLHRMKHCGDSVFIGMWDPNPMHT